MNKPHQNTRPKHPQKHRERPQQPATIDALNKLPPQAIEAEQVILGALLLEKDAITLIADILQPQHFYHDHHQTIYTAILALFSGGHPIDPITVTNQLRQQGQLQLIGGAHALTALTSRVNAAVHIEYHARLVIEQYIKRQIIQCGMQMSRAGYDDTTDAFELLNSAQQGLFQIAEQHIKKGPDSMATLVQQELKALAALKESPTGLTGIPCGFPSLERLTAGFQRADLIIIAARPGMGNPPLCLPVPAMLLSPFSCRWPYSL